MSVAENNKDIQEIKLRLKSIETSQAQVKKNRIKEAEKVAKRIYQRTCNHDYVNIRVSYNGAIFKMYCQQCNKSLPLSAATISMHRLSRKLQKKLCKQMKKY